MPNSPEPNTSSANTATPGQKSLPFILNQRLLLAFVRQYQAQHQGQLPKAIQLTPQAALALALKEAYRAEFLGVPLVAAPFDDTEVVAPGQGRRLGVFLHGQPEALRACDLA
jgi:hypothetical protein